MFRAFIAVEVPFSAELDRFSKAVKGSGANLKIVDLQNIHITLKFLGDTDEAIVPEIEKIMNSAVSGVLPFKMQMKGTGAFPNLDKISVIWAGLEGAETLGVIAKRIDDGLKPLGFEPEKRKFSPHVTVARVRDSRNRRELAEIIHGWETGEFGDVPVGRIILKKSVLTPQGPMYSDISTAKLKIC
ncbi:MAG: RNA 2',3'-cyclic phosphodiesterase [Candidatus Thermoplasmatota archaeon]|nr:RNA 2',3'-cyclic phosphodiesterase [Candidatus Thermoplasmatota archaeon]MBU4071516.1 RNA 2',3'-cyclic phosphodiesterase [Candidatus Thermoplasmatota archaeon]MBU4144161.1 RNA 2',3'-cyclic phosphodiesterase [Candidatus Thermoplasmatota archaeon]MBU4592795.1 RNA 2',3'-cyclic phosphodiesterase [Candidatus Thermoplasmatota archaeon]